MPVVISPAPSSLPPSGAAGGDLGGTYPNPTTDLNTAGGTMLGALTVTSSNTTASGYDVEVAGTHGTSLTSLLDLYTNANETGVWIRLSAQGGTTPSFFFADSSGNNIFALGSLGLAFKNENNVTCWRADFDGASYFGLSFKASISAAGLGTFKGVHGTTITSGALPTVAPSSATAFQCDTTRDVTLTVPITTDGTANAATCLVEISPDNLTFSALGTFGPGVAVNTVGGIVFAVTVAVPAAWRVKLTVSHASLGTGTYY